MATCDLSCIAKTEDPLQLFTSVMLIAQTGVKRLCIAQHPTVRVVLDIDVDRTLALSILEYLELINDRLRRHVGREYYFVLESAGDRRTVVLRIELSDVPLVAEGALVVAAAVTRLRIGAV